MPAVNRFFFLASLLFSSHLSAVIYTDLNGYNLISCLFSSAHNNRIVVENGRIKKFYCPDGDLSLRFEELTGQVFVYSLVPNPRPATVTIVTDDAIVQDIELHFVEKPAEVLVLRTPCKKEQVDEFNCPCCPCKNPIGIPELINSIMAGYVPQGYAVFDLEPTCYVLTNGVKMTKYAKLLGRDEAIYLWRITNTSGKAKKICEKGFNIPNKSWAYLDKDCLNPMEETFGIVAVKL